MSERLTRRVRMALALLCGVAGAVWYLWPLLDRETVDVIVVGDGAVGEAADEIARRFRQEGFLVEVDVVADCAAVGTAGDAAQVLSFSTWEGCDLSLLDRAALVVQQPGGALPPAGSVRPALPLFDGDRVACRWWDTPGAGEVRPGLGQCEDDGMVTVRVGARLTDAGKERFARLMVEAVPRRWP